MKRLFIVSATLAVLAFLVPGPAFSAGQGKEAVQSQPSEAEPELAGKVVETMDSGGYTYIRIETASGKKLWVAVRQMKVKKGEYMAFIPGGVMVNFKSKTLNRTFDEIIFSPGPLQKQQSTHGAETAGSKGQVVTSTEKIRIDKASGKNAYTVAEVYKKSGSLNKKKVIVRAKVVKVSENIMKKNWLHIQDGSGDPAKGTQDLVVTTNDLPSVGDVITVSGTVATGKDFGAGYNYRVLIEDASVKK